MTFDLLIIFLGAFQGLSSGLHNALAGANLPTGANLPATAGWPYGALQVRNITTIIIHYVILNNNNLVPTVSFSHAVPIRLEQSLERRTRYLYLGFVQIGVQHFVV